MLVIGDLNSKKLCHNVYDTYHNEYICEGEEDVKKNIEKFKLSKKNLIAENHLSVTYKKGNKTFSFHNSANYLLLYKIYRLSAGNRLKDRYASILTEWAVCKARVKFIHHDVNSWCNRIETYLELSEKLKNFNPNIVRMIKGDATGLSSWVINTHGINKNIHKSRPFDYYKKKDLYNLVSPGESKYMSLMLSQSNFDNTELVTEHLFNKRLSYNDKIKAVLEKLYVETINEYIIPEMKRSGNLPEDLLGCFLKTYMNMSSLYTSYTFVGFAIENYYEVIDQYDEKVFNIVFHNAYTNKLINEIK